MPVLIKTQIKLPEYVKESIRSLISSITKKNIDVKIEVHTESKTDKQRKYFWSLVQAIRSCIKNGQTENDIYHHILREHGISSRVEAKEEELYLVKSYYRIIEHTGTRTLFDEEGNQYTEYGFRCWKGLSKYTIDEACMLIDGAIYECQQLDIPTDTPDEIRRMKEQWGVDIG